MGIFIFISTLLHIASLYFIFILWKNGEQIKTSTLNGQEMQDIEILLEEFSVQMKNENEKLKQLILKYQYESNSKQNDASEPFTNNSYEPSSILQNEKIEEDKDKNDVIILSKQGYTSTEIAKKLNRGKGEIELLLRFYG